MLRREGVWGLLSSGREDACKFFGLFVVEWTKALEYGRLRLFALLAVLLKTHGSEDKWTFSVFFRCLVIEHPYMRNRA